MLSAVSGFVRPDILIEVEVWAAKQVNGTCERSD
jgi:hypothetical protein